MTGPVWDGRGRDPWMPARLDARLEAASMEREIRASVWAALSEWLVALERRLIRSGASIDLTAVWSMEPSWRQAVDEILRGSIWQAVTLAFRKIFRPGYPVDQRPAINRYLTEVRNRLVRVPDEVFDLVAGQIAAGANLGESIRELALRVDDVLSTTGSERWPNRATVIARTETIGALNAGRADAFAAAADELDQPMEKLWLCVLPDTPIIAAGVRWVARRWYEGEALTLRTASGRRVSVTPEHPVLTVRGWVPARNLHVGDQLVSVPRIDPVGTPDVQRGYALISECFDTASETGEVRTLTRGMPRGVDLHGHVGRDQKIDVVAVNRNLTVGLEPSEAEPLLDFCLETSDQTLARLIVDGTVAHGLISDQLPSTFPGHASDVGTRSVPGDTVTTSGAAVAEIYPGTAEMATDSVVTGPESDRQHADRLSRLVELDDLVSVEVISWAGHVYDFTTSCQWFMADGLVVHNSTDDSRTRPTHDLADGQRVPVGQPFIVGGFPLAFPGDPTGPPQEVIQCRCTMLLVEPGEFVDLSNRQFRRDR